MLHQVYVDGRQKLREQQYVGPGKVENKREDLKIDLMWEEFKRIADLRMSSRVQPENIKGRITILFGENVTLEILDEIIWCIAKNGECIERKKLPKESLLLH